MPLARVRRARGGALASSIDLMCAARNSDKRLFSGSGPVALVWPTTSRQALLARARSPMALIQAG